MRSSFMVGLKNTFGIPKTQKVFFSLTLKDKIALYVLIIFFLFFFFFFSCKEAS